MLSIDFPGWAVVRARGRSSGGRHRRAPGFTLIEVLVVVAIIALLISILMPSLKKAKEMGKRTKCLAGLHQMGIGFVGYATDNRGYLPIRGHYGYLISEHRYLHTEGMNKNHPQAKIKDKVDFGVLYGKYIGRDTSIFYCPSIQDKYWEDSTYGIKTFEVSYNDAMWVTWGGYMYAAPVATGEYPRASGKTTYPSETWHEHFINEWLIRQKGYTKANYTTFPMARMQALMCDGIIGGGAGTTAMRGAHGDGVNALYNDYHAKFVQDIKGTLRNLNPSSGPGGANALYTVWEFMTRNY